MEHSDVHAAEQEWSDATTLLDLQRRGAVSAEEIVRHQLAVIADRGAVLKAVVSVDQAGAIAAARRVDERRAAGEHLGLLAGVPVTVKDSFAVAGLSVSDGRPESLHRSDRDAPAVARVRAQDAVLLGKTNVPVLLADYQTDNPLHGRTSNPWDVSRTAGGSSGGSAAAVGGGLSVADVGSDLSGSIRIPASYAGVFGHVPSSGVVSKLAHLPVPLSSGQEPPLSRTGPLTRSAADLRLMLLSMAGAGPDSAAAWTLRLPPSQVKSLAGMRVGLWFEDDAAPVTDETRRAVEGLAEAMEAAGCRVEPFVSPTPAAVLSRLFDRLCSAELVRGLPRDAWLAACAAEQALPLADRLLSQSLWQSAQDREEQHRISTTWDEAFDRVDVVLAPTVDGAAPPHSDVPFDARTVHHDGVELLVRDVVGTWSKLANVLDAPSTVVPAGLGGDSTMPIGAQLIGRRLHDLTTIRIAELLEQEQVIGWRRPGGGPPGPVQHSA